MKILDHKDSIIYHKDAINRRLYKRPIIVEMAIHRVFCLNQTVLTQILVQVIIF
ncbi:hypothetical protein HUN01_15865 [Nostoc edaphicum CCNP1411]|uniref:Uncharacterized protein n=1 Tax=Nostoc edaphicum CCNP1411 TaxID=1472755 RepID=A0A7D7QMT1_9NOSO|nr:hypothetical protein [Nostoc edaphicum]QMS89005.1 hypothetical protein HUN01_15865 [Nostoc edaphicum CCNP1411]